MTAYGILSMLEHQCPSIYFRKDAVFFEKSIIQKINNPKSSRQDATRATLHVLGELALHAQVPAARYDQVSTYGRREDTVALRDRWYINYAPVAGSEKQV